jgi:hypothetical protein
MTQEIIITALVVIAIVLVVAWLEGDDDNTYLH